MTKPRSPKSLPDGWISVSTPPGVCAFVTTRHHPLGRSRKAFAEFNLATHVGDDAERVAGHRAYLGDVIGGHPLQWLEQVHGNHCVTATRCLTPAPRADAACTGVVNLALAVMSADCVPVLLWDSAASKVAVCHAGWQGLVKGIIPATVAAMRVQDARLSAWIGPSIGIHRYEVGEDVWGAFEHDRYSHCLADHTDRHKRYLDLGGVAEVQLTQLGVNLGGRAAQCTYDEVDLYSHRAHQHSGSIGECGRFATVIWLDGSTQG